MDRDKAELRWGVEQRLEFIEFRLFWEGLVNRIDVMQQFGVSVNQASSDLNRYIALAPDNMVYDKSARTYVRGRGFDCKFRPPDAAHYLAQLRLVADDVLEREDCWIPDLPSYASATVLARELRRKGLCNKQGTLVDKGYLYRVLVNRVYRGDAVHKGKAYPGEHRAIIDEQLWDQVHAILRESPRKRANNTRAQAPALLKGLIFTATGAAMTPSSTKNGARRYRYYVSMDVIKNREPSDEGIPRRLPADLVEAAVVTELRRVMRAPSITAQVIAHLAREGHAFAEADVISALQTFEDVWGQLFPAEQTRIVQLLVRRVTVTSEGLVIDVRTDGVSGVMRDMMAPRKKVAAE